MDNDGITIGHEENEPMKKHTIWDSIMKNNVAEIKKPTCTTMRQKPSQKLWCRSISKFPFRTTHWSQGIQTTWRVMQICHNIFLMKVKSRNTSTSNEVSLAFRTREKSSGTLSHVTWKQCKHTKKHYPKSGMSWKESQKGLCTYWPDPFTKLVQ